ncbi:hypothetical protein VTN02DRAFT_2103 [Thermoascus thermophilus]
MIPSRRPHGRWPLLLLLLLEAWMAIITILPLITGVSGMTTIPVREPSPTEDATSAQYTSDRIFRDTVLDETNHYRAQHDAHPLTWNETLQAYAQDWADRCLWRHSHGPYGENLAGGYANASAAVFAWADERRMYNFSKPTGFTEATGHFTQLVWKATRQVGCARVDCGQDPADDDDSTRAKGWYVVCEYAPAGNVVGYNNKFFKANVEPQGGASGGDDHDHDHGASGSGSGSGSSAGESNGSHNGNDDDDDDKSGAAFASARMSSICVAALAVAVVFVVFG